MGLAPGQRLSQYEIIALLGAGGMGEVWRARDTRLGREVAIKVLPDALSGGEEWLRRFEREARALGCLSHPNLATVYGIDQTESTCFIAMELVPGEDLAARLARGPLPLAKALDVCRQIAEGLEAAHEAGVIHRDLKPANVVVTGEGRAKLLDFGLAKPVPLAGAPALPRDGVLTTDPGRVLGTPTYMAPEQASGRPADRRTDVWAFGCVLYECLTGRRAFDGNQLGTVLAAIVHDEPDWESLPAGTPRHVRELLARCLDKEPRSRLRDIGEARIALERAPAPLPAGPGVRRSWLGPAVLSLALGSAGFLLRGWILAPVSGEERSALHLHRLTSLAGMEESPALSPDGEKVAFVSRVDGKRQVFLQTQGAPQALTTGPAEHSSPRWIDEGTLLYFRHPGDGGPGALLERILFSSTLPRPVLEPAEGEADVSHDGRFLATFRTDDQGPSLVIVERRGERRPAVHRLPYAIYGKPRWSPDDRSIAFQSRIYLTHSQLLVLDVESGRQRTLLEEKAAQVNGLTWLPDGSGLVYASSQGSTVPYPPVHSLRRLDLAGGHDEPIPLLDAGYATYVEPDIAAGKLIASRVRMDSDIWRFPVEAASPRESGARAERITWQTGLVQVPSVSPDGQEVAYISDGGGHGNIWVARVDGRESPRKITDETDPGVVIGLPVWSTRDDRIVYWRSSKQGYAELRLTDSRGSRDELLVHATGGAHWSSDGQWLYYIAAVGTVGLEQPTYRVRVDGGEPELVREAAVGMRVSSDGRTAYYCHASDRFGEVWKATPLDGPEELLVEGLDDRIPLWPHEYALSWDDRWLATPLRDEGTTNLWRISTDDGSLHQVTDFEHRATTIGRLVSWSPDGRFLYAAVLESDADVVLLEGALP